MGRGQASVLDVIIDGCMGVVATFTLFASQTMVSQLIGQPNVGRDELEEGAT